MGPWVLSQLTEEKLVSAFTLPLILSTPMEPNEVSQSMLVCFGTVMLKLTPTERLFFSLGFSTLTVSVFPAGTSFTFTFSAISAASSSVGAWTQIVAVTLQSATSAPVTVIEPRPVSATSIEPAASGADTWTVLSNSACDQPPMLMQEQPGKRISKHSKQFNDAFVK